MSAFIKRSNNSQSSPLLLFLNTLMFFAPSQYRCSGLPIDKKPTDNDIGRALHRYRRGHTYKHRFFNSHYQSSFIELTSSREKKSKIKIKKKWMHVLTLYQIWYLYLYIVVGINQPLSIASLRNRTVKRLCVTNVTGLLRACFVVIFT